MEVKEKEILDEVSKLTAAAEQLSIRGEGSEILLEFRVPEGVTVNFGALPESQNKWPADANNYCICIGGKTTFYSSDASFSNPEINGPISLGSGRHRLLLSTKTESNSGRLFVLISDKGTIKESNIPGACAVRDFNGDNSAWADFLISKAALILASIVLFAAFFHLFAGFKDLEAQEQLDYLALGFQNRSR